MLVALAVALVVVLAVLLAVVAKARPAYDAMGFLVWGHQALHWNLNLNGAPSWKPLPFLVTFPLALLGHRGEQWLWIVVADAGAVASVLLAGRLAYRMSPPNRTWARLIGALIAAYGMASMVGYARLALIANSDPLIVAFTLGAIDCHLSRRPRVALVLLLLVALGRPEGWLFLFAYAAWLWRGYEQARWLPLAAVAFTLAIWFIVPAITSKSWMLPSDFAMGQATVIHGNKFIGVFERIRTLTALPIQIAALATVALACRRRDRGMLWLLGLSVLWAAVEVAFALHGYSAVQRYLIEPGAVLLVLVGVGVGTALSYSGGIARWLGPLAVIVLLVSLAPYTHDTARMDHALVSEAHQNAATLSRLDALVAADGGPARILACGQPVTTLTYQSTVAWELGLNVGSVQYGLRAVVHDRGPVVAFEPVGQGWRSRVVRPAAGSSAACGRLNRAIAA